jgi:hypothetical protein
MVGEKMQQPKCEEKLNISRPKGGSFAAIFQKMYRS